MKWDRKSFDARVARDDPDDGRYLEWGAFKGGDELGPEDGQGVRLTVRVSEEGSGQWRDILIPDYIVMILARDLIKCSNLKAFSMKRRRDGTWSVVLEAMPGGDVRDYHLGSMLG